jgi:hypothetical protein
MAEPEIRYLAAGLCVLAFLAAQTFQQFAYGSRIPAPKGPADELQNYLLPVDRLRALLVGGTILLLLVPYAAVTLRYFEAAPVASLLGLIFGAGFVGLETVHRGIDYFVVGQKWARQHRDASEAERAAILRRYSLWGEVTHGWYFPLLLAHLLASCCYLAVTETDIAKVTWHALAPVAFALNALRLTGRLAGTYGGVARLEALSGKLYYPAVLVINALLAAWFFCLALRLGP